jgi:hypothetical protein
MRAHLPAELSANFPPFKNAIDIADGAPLIDRLIAWYGRQP